MERKRKRSQSPPVQPLQPAHSPFSCHAQTADQQPTTSIAVRQDEGITRSTSIPLPLTAANLRRHDPTMNPPHTPTSKPTASSTTTSAPAKSASQTVRSIRAVLGINNLMIETILIGPGMINGIYIARRLHLTSP